MENTKSKKTNKSLNISIILLTIVLLISLLTKIYFLPFSYTLELKYYPLIIYVGAIILAFSTFIIIKGLIHRPIFYSITPRTKNKVINLLLYIIFTIIYLNVFIGLLMVLLTTLILIIGILFNVIVIIYLLCSSFLGPILSNIDNTSFISVLIGAWGGGYVVAASKILEGILEMIRLRDGFVVLIPFIGTIVAVFIIFLISSVISFIISKNENRKINKYQAKKWTYYGISLFLILISIIGFITITTIYLVKPDVIPTESYILYTIMVDYNWIIISLLAIITLIINVCINKKQK